MLRRARHERSRHSPAGGDARTVEHLIGLDRFSLRAVERRANGDFALVFKKPARRRPLGPAWVLRIPAKRVFGYQQRSPYVRDRWTPAPGSEPTAGGSRPG